MTPIHGTESTSRIGELVAGPSWLRGLHAYGEPQPGFALLVSLWWPLSDPKPTEGWWI